MNRCTNCRKYPFCDKITDVLLGCENWDKRKIENNGDIKNGTSNKKS